jgi:hypothetical protein
MAPSSEAILEEIAGYAISGDTEIAGLQQTSLWNSAGWVQDQVSFVAIGTAAPPHTRLKMDGTLADTSRFRVRAGNKVLKKSVNKIGETGTCTASLQ